MLAAKRQQRSYDHRLRHYNHDSGDLLTAKKLGVPSSTIHGWRHHNCGPVVSHVQHSETDGLTSEIASLKRQNEVLRAWLRVALVLFKLTAFSFER